MISSSRFRVDTEKILCYPLGLVFGGTFSDLTWNLELVLLNLEQVYLDIIHRLLVHGLYYRFITKVIKMAIMHHI